MSIALLLLAGCLALQPVRAQLFLPEGTASLDYLIVTSDSLVDEFMPLLEWKYRKGLRVGIVSMEDLESSSNERTIQLKIKRRLAHYYDLMGLRWVLLGGDERIVPFQGCYSSVNMGAQSVTDYHIPTDLFYACFDNRFDWNGYVDDKIGQIYVDGHDIIPDVDITRAPVHTREQVRVFVQKVLRYERDRAPVGFFDSMLLCGVRGWSGWEGKSDSHHRSEVFYNNYVSGRWQGERMAFYDTGTDFPGNSEYNVSALNLTTQLNTGYSYFQHTGHGNLQQLAMESGRSFHSDDAADLSNPFPGLVLANGCHTNAYDSIDPCLSEAFLRNPDGGAVAYLGNTRFGFGNPNEEDPELGPSLKYYASFARFLFGPSPEWKHFGSLVSLAKKDNYLNGTSGGAYSYLLYSLTPMGDPEMPLYTTEQKEFDNVRIYWFGEELTLNTGGVSNCRISVTSEDLYEGFREVVEGGSHHVFKDLPDTYCITITAPGYLPYRFASSSTGIHGSMALSPVIYPNPVSDIMYLDWILPGGHLSLFDMSGRLMLEQELHHGQNTISTGLLSSGSYVLQISTPNGTIHQKILKR